jgi:hypothetical protein
MNLKSIYEAIIFYFGFFCFDPYALNLVSFFPEGRSTITQLKCRVLVNNFYPDGEVLPCGPAEVLHGIQNNAVNGLCLAGAWLHPPGDIGA